MGVGHNPGPLSPVRGVDGTSRNNKRPDGVPEGFQVRKHSVEAHFHRNKTRDILAKHPSGMDSFDNSSHFRPEITVIFMAAALPGNAEWLAGESPANKVNCAKFISFDIADIRHPHHVGPMFLEDREAEGITLHLADAFHPRPFQAQVETANASKEGQEPHSSKPSITSPSHQLHSYGNMRVSTDQKTSSRIAGISSKP